MLNQRDLPYQHLLLVLQLSLVVRLWQLELIRQLGWLRQLELHFMLNIELNKYMILLQQINL